MMFILKKKKAIFSVLGGGKCEEKNEVKVIERCLFTSLHMNIV